MKRLFLLVFLLIPALSWAQYPNTHFIQATPTIDTSAYATGELMGGKMTFTGALRSQTGSGFLVSVTVSDKAATTTDMELVLFGADPSSTTFTDQAAFDPADADLSKVIAVIALGSAERFTWNDNAVKYKGSLAIPIGQVGVNSVTIYGALVSRGAPTFATSGDMTVTLGVSQD